MNAAMEIVAAMPETWPGIVELMSSVPDQQRMLVSVLGRESWCWIARVGALPGMG